MPQDKILTSGALGRVATRLEINDFIKDKKQLSLYIQALNAMFSETSDPRISWFSVGGIHGMPYVDWDQSPAPIDPKTGKPGPFCAHSTPLFPTWHRPYVALIEQIICSHAVTIAEKYTVDKELWKSAAAKLRQPYWDWAVNSVPPDVVISDKKVKILQQPKGDEVEVDNPFLHYQFRNASERKGFLPPFNDWEYTLRYPTGTDKHATSDVKKLKLHLEKLNSGHDSVTYRTYRLFSITDWKHFSTTASSTVPVISANSLEGVHNTLHLAVGGRLPESPSGHMSENEYAAFDPIFYLHHCQVDRLLSLWSEIQGVWIDGPDASKDLTPFWKTQSSYWNSAGTKTTSLLNYTYPELSGNSTRNDVALKVNKLYGGATSDPGPVQSHSLHPSQQLNSITEWSARIRSKQFEVGGSFSVLVFLGVVPKNPNEWYTCPTFVGTFDAFVNHTPEVCANCQTHADGEISGVVHLNGAIKNINDDHASFHPDYVVPRLTKELAWRIMKVDGTVVEPHGLPSLEVVVTATPLTLSPGAILPTAGEPQPYHDITRGTPGGSRAT